MSDAIPQRLWLEWAKQIQAISQAGLAYSKDMYDLERFEMLRELSVDILSRYTEVETEKVRSLFANDTGYATPKVDVRGAVFQDDRILLVRERIDGAWALPGGWADIGLSPKEVVVKKSEGGGRSHRRSRAIAGGLGQEIPRASSRGLPYLQNVYFVRDCRGASGSRNGDAGGWIFRPERIAAVIH